MLSGNTAANPYYGLWAFPRSFHSALTSLVVSLSPLAATVAIVFVLALHLLSPLQSCSSSDLYVIKNQTLLERPHCLRIPRLSKQIHSWRGLTVSTFRGCQTNTFSWRGPMVSIRGMLHNSLLKRPLRRHVLQMCISQLTSVLC